MNYPALRSVLLLAGAVALGWYGPTWGLGFRDRPIAEATATDAVGATPAAQSFAPLHSPIDDPGQTAALESLFEGLPYEPGRLVLKLSDGLGLRGTKAGAAASGLGGAPSLGSAALDRLNRRHGIRSVRKPFEGRAARAAARLSLFPQRTARAARGAVAPRLDNVHVLELSPFLDMEKVAREYAAVPGVIYAEPDRRVEAVLLPDDPFLTSSGSWRQSFGDLWGLENIDAQAAWDVTRGAGTVIAITDTGIDPDHPDIASRIWTNPAEVPANGIDDDGNGFVDDSWGWDFYNDDNDPFDDHGHGTHVAGTAAATGGNGLGIAGVAWEASVMALKGLGSSGGGSGSDLARTILYAVDNGADVINASWGGGSSQLVSEAIATAHAVGVVFVAAAGNASIDARLFFPANHPDAITVSAFDHTDRRAWFSNNGPKIDVAAPGGGDEGPITVWAPHRSILSLLSSGAGSGMTDSGLLIVNGDYVRQAGTSMAAPHVAGAAALVLAVHPEFSAEQVRQALRTSADDVGSAGFDSSSGYGRLNVGRAVRVDNVLEAHIESPAPGAIVSRNSVDVVGTVGGDDFASYTLDFGKGDFPSAWTTLAGPVTTPAVGDLLATWDLSALSDGEYTLRLRGTTSAGASFEDRVAFVLDRVMMTDPAAYTILRGGGPIEIRGTVFRPDLRSYTIEYRLTGADLEEGAWTTEGISLSGGGTTSIIDGVLAILDSSVLGTGYDVDFQLSAHTAEETTRKWLYHVVIEPGLHAGWPRQIPVLPDFSQRMRGHVTLADLDRDGSKEVLAAYGDLVFVMRPDGSDFPGWPRSVAGQSAYVDTSPAAADLDNDGDLELVAGNHESIFIWHHDGTPLAGWPKEFIYQPHAGVRGTPDGNFVLEDLDGDGKRDIIFSWGGALAAIRIDGSFLPGFPVEISSTDLSPPPFEWVAAVGDVDGDGSPEIAIVENERRKRKVRQKLHVYGADGQLKRRWPKKISGKRFAENWPIMADLDGDGILDIITNTDKVKRLRAFKGWGKNIRLRTKLLKHRVGVVRSAQEQLSAGDINGDGLPEVFVSTDFPQPWERCRRGSCRWYSIFPPYGGFDYLQAASPIYRTMPGWPVEFFFMDADNAHGPGTPAIGDIDGDGEQNIVIGSGVCAYWDPDRGFHRCFTIYAFRPDGSLLPGFPKPTPGPGATKSVMPAIGDLDGDGLKEIVWVDFFGNVLVWSVPGTPGPENMQWPMFRHDPAHTGALR